MRRKYPYKDDSLIKVAEEVERYTHLAPEVTRYFLLLIRCHSQYRYAEHGELGLTDGRMGGRTGGGGMGRVHGPTDA